MVKLLIASNSPVAQTGYGNQTAILAKLNKQHGGESIVYGFFGHKGGVMRWEGIDILPASLDLYGRDLLALHYQHYAPDVTLVLFDAWVYQREQFKQVPMTMWAPIDHEPMPQAVNTRLQEARHIWAMSRHGEREMRKAGLDPWYVPHAIDTTQYRPDDRKAAREQWRVPDGTFFAVMVAANKGTPARKSFDRVFKAWARFVEQRPQSLLYVHTLPGDQFEGIDLEELAAFYGIPGHTLRFPDIYFYLRGDYDTTRMNALYNAADVLVAPSMGEGFGIPVVEAQAAGCPVIVSDWTAQTELAGPGYVIPIDRFDDLHYTAAESEQARAKPSEILKALEWAYQQRGNEVLRRECREFALDYDAMRVWQRYMQPSLEAIKQIDAVEVAAMKQRREAA